MIPWRRWRKCIRWPPGGHPRPPGRGAPVQRRRGFEGSAREYAARADTVQICLSKGLGAPVARCWWGPPPGLPRRAAGESAWAGNAPGRGYRRPGIIALQEMVDRLAEDQNARYLAERLAELRFLLDPAEVETNIVVAEFYPLPRRGVGRLPGAECASSPSAREGKADHPQGCKPSGY